MTEPKSYKIDIADSALADALAAVEKRERERSGGAAEVPMEVASEDGDAPAEIIVDVPASAPAAPAAAPAPAPAPAPARKASPQDAIIEALVRAKQEALEALKQTQSEAKELIEARARIQAEFENYKKRVFKEKQEARFDVTKRLAQELLPVLDNFERAVAHVDPAAATPEMKNLVQGIVLVHKQMQEAVKKVGVSWFDSKGQPFDPARHEAISQVPAPPGISAGTVVEEHQRGYLLGEQLLRPAMVVVAGPPESSQ